MVMASSKPRVFNIPASAPFLPTLIDALVNDRLGLNFPAAGDPLALADATLYLPTRRACRLARDVFLATMRTEAAILPRIVPIGDVDPDEIAFAEASAGAPSAATLELPEALDGLERRMALAELILKWSRQIEPDEPDRAPLVAGRPATALMLAADLARLMDDMTTRQVGWEKLDGLIPSEMDKYWEITLEFLKFIRMHWPAILSERGKIEPAERRDKLIEAERVRLGKIRGPVIAAGSTGSMPATAALIETIAKLPHGAVVLPGLDINLDPASWTTIGDGEMAIYSHPQFAMHALLGRIGIARGAVKALAEPAVHGRERLASEALRPAAASELWRARLEDTEFAAHANAALNGVAMVEAANAEEEALAIAIALRQAMDTPGKTAALVTPDRALARRVMAALTRWNVPVDDSGGDALADTPLGVFARLVAEATLDGLSPVKLLAMLKHPLCRADQWAVAALERAILRGPRPKAGSEGLRLALLRFREELGRLRKKEASDLHRSDPRIGMHDGELDAAEALVAQLQAAASTLETLGGSAAPFADIAQRHREAVDALLDADKVDPDGIEARELDKVFTTIVDGGRVAVPPSEYPEMFQAALADGGVVRPRNQDARVRIYGLLEARLQNVDCMVLGGLTEGVWPPEPRVDPWLSRPMRQQLGLDLPERRIGLTAHDFVQALGAREVVLTRAARIAGAPTVASRFVQRLAAVAGAARWSDALNRGEQYLNWARALDRPPQRPEPVKRPEPRPPREARPNSLSVTEIETLLRDPYSIYARHVLKLRQLDAVDTPLGARDRGTVIHEAVGDFTELFVEALPDDMVAQLIKIGEGAFAPLRDFPDARAFWWPRFQRIAHWLAQFETERRPKIKKLYAEVDGKIDIPRAERPFTLRTRADRIEELDDGRFAILDYKTGRASSKKEVKTGLAPQLTLEGAILRAGGFGDFGAGKSLAELAYVSIRGGEPPGELKPMDWDDTTPDAQADRALQKLMEVIARFDDATQPYLSKERPMFMRRFPGEYDHLARVKEWSLSGGAEEDEAAGE
jgi:ATP-dependent helicase/nuclease subunit B